MLTSIRRRLLVGLFAGGLAAAAGAAVAASDHPYDETADARAAIDRALVESAHSRAPVLVVFGANWCPDCRVLDRELTRGESATLIARDFKVVKVDVGRFDRNVKLAESCGVPLKMGIPAVAVLTPDGHVAYSTRGGELADARKMGPRGIYDFFKHIAARAHP